MSQHRERAELLGTIICSLPVPGPPSEDAEALGSLGTHTRGLIISQPPADTGSSVDTVVSQALSSGEHGASVLPHPKVIPSRSGNRPAVPPCKHNLSLQPSHIGPVIKYKVESGQRL